MSTRTKWIVGAVAAVALFGIIDSATTEDGNDVPAAAVATEQEEAEEVEVEEVDVEPAVVDEEPVNATGDYASGPEWADEALDSSTKISSLMNVTGEAAFKAASGEISFSQYADLMTIAREQLSSHRTFFSTRTPPDRWATVNDKMLEAWDTYDEAFTFAIACGRQEEPSLCERAVTLMERGTQLTNDATALVE